MKIGLISIVKRQIFPPCYVKSNSWLIAKHVLLYKFLKLFGQTIEFFEQTADQARLQAKTRSNTWLQDGVDESNSANTATWKMMLAFKKNWSTHQTLSLQWATIKSELTTRRGNRCCVAIAPELKQSEPFVCTTSLRSLRPWVCCIKKKREHRGLQPAYSRKKDTVLYMLFYSIINTSRQSVKKK